MPLDVHTLDIITYPADVLRTKAQPIDPADPDVARVALRMIEIMHRLEGIGLAAPQIGLPWRLFVCHVPEDPERQRSAASDPPSATTAPLICINPVLSTYSQDRETFSEGCLSLPEIRGEVIRPIAVTMRALDPRGHTIERRAQGLLARCWQHETDHLDGILILDRMTQLSRLKNRQRVREMERSA
ncbi:peptide deformylase [soil metagenome]